jgi:gamma-glutamylcyclotransferase (GGCT)/AIG2-like uncharacterized protein YtfP
MFGHLFVYGTLRPGNLHPLAIRLQRQARLIGSATAAGTLYDLGGCPGALFQAGARDRILGDVFALGHAERLLKLLDEYEGVNDNKSNYARLTIEVSLERGGMLEAWAYGLRVRPPRARRIDSGDFITHARSLSPRPLRP